RADSCQDQADGAPDQRLLHRLIGRESRRDVTPHYSVNRSINRGKHKKAIAQPLAKSGKNAGSVQTCVSADAKNDDGKKSRDDSPDTRSDVFALSPFRHERILLFYPSSDGTRW